MTTYAVVSGESHELRSKMIEDFGVSILCMRAGDYVISQARVPTRSSVPGRQEETGVFLYGKGGTTLDAMRDLNKVLITNVFINPRLFPTLTGEP